MRKDVDATGNRVARSEKLSSFRHDDVVWQVSFVETMKVKDGVICEVYAFEGDKSRDLAIIHVEPSHTTPRQRVLKGNKTIEGFVSGNGSLIIEGAGESAVRYEFDDENGESSDSVSVELGQIMQWQAGEAGLVFYEICEPPYEDGRFENIAD